jgi:Co/Zn/Cd efflux system component
MSAHCCDHETPAADKLVDLPRYRRVLWIALVVNAAMFVVEIAGGVTLGLAVVAGRRGGLCG